MDTHIELTIFMHLFGIHNGSNFLFIPRASQSKLSSVDNDWASEKEDKNRDDK